MKQQIGEFDERAQQVAQLPATSNGPLGFMIQGRTWQNDEWMEYLLTTITAWEGQVDILTTFQNPFQVHND